MENKKQTAVDWFFDKLKSHFEHDGDLFESCVMTYSIAKLQEKEQLGNAWDNGIEAHEQRGYNISRSFSDFDDYYNENYGK